MLASKTLGSVSASSAPPDPSWDVSNAQFLGTATNFFYVGDKETGSSDIFFKPDGTKMYIIGSTGDAVNEYNLSTAWDVSTASYVQRFSVNAQESQPHSLFFKPDGTKMYVLGRIGDDVNEYNLSTAWNVSTASYVQVFSVALQEGTPNGLFFKPDGTKMYVLGSDGDDVNEYNLSTAWDVSTASYVQVFSVAIRDTNPNGLFFKDDGTKMYVIGSTNDRVHEYNLSTAWDVSTASYVQFFNVNPQETTPNGLFFKADGTVMYVIGNNNNKVYQYQLSTAWNVSTATYSQPTTKYFNVTTQGTTPTDIFFKPDGTKLYTCDNNSNNINEYNLSTAWAIETASFLQSFSIAAQEADVQGLFFKADGTKMYITGTGVDNVQEYNLSTAWNISTATYVQAFSVATEDTAPNGLFFKPDGTKMYVTGSVGSDVNEYNLSTAWDVSTASYVQVFATATLDAQISGVFFKPDGTKMYTTGRGGDEVNQFNLSTAWNISTATYSQELSVKATTLDPEGLFFKDDGLRLYVITADREEIWEYDLV